MRYAMKSFLILLFVGMTLTLGRCGRLSNASKDGSREGLESEDILYIPDSWNGDEDWSENALKVEDIAP